MASSLISIAAENLIIEQEVTSAARYKAKYTRPTWPGGDSGVTVGLGVDLGYMTISEIDKAWGSRLGAETVRLMKAVAGVKGQQARQLVLSGRYASIVVPWEVALDEFEQIEIPKWVDRVRAVYPNTEGLNKDCLGALVSLAYNRGLRLSGPTRVEMANIKTHLQTGNLHKIPNEIRKMKRLWVGKGLDGLLDRRDQEAAMFEKGLLAG